MCCFILAERERGFNISEEEEEKEEEEEEEEEVLLTAYN